MKKVLVVAFSLFALFLLVGCTNENNEDIKVGLIVSAAGANDNGYNQFAIEGLNQAKDEFGIQIQVVNTANDVPGSLETLGEEGFDLVFSLEYNFGALITDDGSGQSIAEKYPDTTFVVFNAFANTDENGDKIHDNVIEVLFNVNEGSFLAGALAVLVNENHELLFTDEDYHFTPTSTSRAVGFVGGTQSDGISVFGYGFAQGVNYIATELNVDYDLYETYSAGFGASTENYNVINSYYTSGANFVFAAAGGVSTNMKNAAAANGKLAIDVDANQDASVPGSVLTSVLKNTNVAIYDIVEQFVEDKLESGKHVFYDLASGATGITDLTTIQGFVSTEAAAQTKWNEIKAKIAELVADISDGTIDVIDAQAGEVLDYSTLTHVNKAN
ncbi:MAG: BMP family ABC transporter substrate-binding protein [Tenericutes bacterium HGW-Tenericutes-1]|jgi:basic membrane protein A|nr:MAG: BMP family ABC transporter substrate-binding protein [Tenericutes bacterium HGW-Tenericutes-1]PKM57013.1 MAG: BMP family ABC transporter substrate-binding protein [Firmicutes bacterium HGW-Firmicutes-3]